MDTSNIRVATSNLADSLVNTMQNFEAQTIGITSGIEIDIMSRHSQILQVISQLYSDMLDLVLESNDLAKVFHIKAKLEAMDNGMAQSQAEIDYRFILQSKLNSLNTNLDPYC